MKRLNRRLIGVALVCIGCFCFASSYANAMAVSPVLFDIQADLNQVVEKNIEITNDTNAVAKYKLSAENFISSGEEGGQLYLEGETDRDLASWFEWPMPMIELQPGESRQVPVRMRIPANAGAGGHYATVFFSRTSIDEQSSVGMFEQIGVLFLVRVSGEVTERASVDSFRVKFLQKPINRTPVVFDLRIKNDGSVHIRPEGTIVITNAVGKTVAKLPINQKKGAILPGGIRRFEIIWGNASGERGSGFWSEVKREWQHFAFGKYRAEIRSVYGDRLQSLPRESVSFWVIPWHLLIVAFGGFFGLIVLHWLYRTCLIRSMIKKSDAKHKTRRTKST